MMTDCATLNDLINVIATLCPTLLCISTSLYTGAHLSALKHTRAVINLIEDKRTLLKKQHIQIFMCLKQKWERNASVRHTCIHPDARCDSACEGSEVVTLLSDSETRHYENYFYRLASHEKLISNIRVAPRQARKWFNWIQFGIEYKYIPLQLFLQIF